MDIFCILMCVLFYVLGLLCPFISATVNFLNLIWKDFIRNRRIKDKASSIAKSRLARRQFEIMKVLINGEQ